MEHDDAPVLRRWLDKQERVSPADRELVLRLFIELNKQVETRMGAAAEDFQIGHSYFMRTDIFNQSGRDRIWRTTIRPLLEECFQNVRIEAQSLIRWNPVSC